MTWLLNWFCPPFRYWLIWSNPKQRFVVVRQRTAPSSNGLRYNHLDSILVDGPFDTTEDAVHSLTFWRGQYPNEKLYQT